ncbi:MAG: ribbon-helix-helix domain-containing protein [Candidatus Bathyarchaeia archaeon]
MKLVTVLLPEAYLAGLDELVRANMYPSRSAAIRSAVRDLLKKELWVRKEE